MYRQLHENRLYMQRWCLQCQANLSFKSTLELKLLQNRTITQVGIQQTKLKLGVLYVSLIVFFCKFNWMLNFFPSLGRELGFLTPKIIPQSDQTSASQQFPGGSPQNKLAMRVSIYIILRSPFTYQVIQGVLRKWTIISTYIHLSNAT